MFRVALSGRFGVRVTSFDDEGDWVQWHALCPRVLRFGPNTAVSVSDGCVETDTMRFRLADVAAQALATKDLALSNALRTHLRR